MQGFYVKTIMRIRSLSILSAALLLSACHQSQIQGEYADESTACRSMAEARVAAFGIGRSTAARNAELVKSFSNCMARKGWQVASPKKEGGSRTTPARSQNTQAQNPQQQNAAQTQPASGNRPTTQIQPAPSGASPNVYETSRPRTSVNPYASIYTPAPVQPEVVKPTIPQ